MSGLKDTVEQKLLKIYAQRFGFSPEELAERIAVMPGDTFIDKLKAFVDSYREGGVTVEGHLIDVLKPRDSVIQRDETTLYRILFKVHLDAPVHTIMKQLGFDYDAAKRAFDDCMANCEGNCDEHCAAHKSELEELEKLVTLLEYPLISILVRNKDMYQKFMSLPIGTRIVLRGFNVSRGSKSDAWFINAKSVYDKGIDFDYLDRESYTVDKIVDMDIQDGMFMLLKFDDIFVVDPLYTTTSSGNPVVRVYLTDNVMLDFYGSAYTALEKKLGDPHDSSAWQDKTFYVGAVYSDTVSDIKRFAVFSSNRVVVK